MNGNSLFDEGTDVVLPGIQVKLTGTTSTGAAVDTAVTTDDQGRARATMRAGDYTATIVNPPAGMTQVTPNAGDDALDSDFDGGTATFTVTSRETTARDGGFFVPMGTFLADKAITGDAAGLVPADTEFTLDYSYPAGAGYPAGSGTLVVTADGTQVESPQIPVGAVVRITEQAPAPIAGTEWGAPEYSSENVTITNGSQLAEFTVTNPISIQYGTFSAKKAVTGETAGIVPGDTEFTLNYSYPAGPGYEAGAGSLTLTADGTPVTSPEIPVGAVVTLEEATPAPVENAEWQRPVLSADTVTIIAGGTSGEIVVTNQLDLKYGSFSAKKELTGEAAGIVPGDTEFTLNYSYPAGPGYEAGAGTLTLTADGTPVTSEPIPYGAVVTLSEAAPAEIPNAVWSAPVLSADELTISAFSSGVEITVTNELNLRYGAFSVAKQLAGDAAGLVADDTEFTVDYAFPAGPGYKAGAGSLTIAADGTPTVQDGIPAGAVVTIEEQDPAAIDGLEWTGVSYSATDATIVADETAEFTVTNEATEVTTPVGPKPDGPELPTTGAAAGWAGGALAAALLAGGAILLLVRRRRIAAE
ncbi:DUF5979 domain-containing protein [Leucobacter luti]|uniref:DUF5979 domain-containing protein n=1 Tax=Leucobacter luti TaxID=340320 RepID=UPI003CFCED30